MKEKKHNCSKCGRPIHNKGNCLSCNYELKHGHKIGKKKSYLKRFENNPNHEYILTEEGNLQSREIAEKYIYLKNKDKYPLNWKKDYVVHHINGETFDNSIKNLYICTKEQHNLIHNEQKSRRKKFNNASEIDIFLNSLENSSLDNFNDNDYLPVSIPKGVLKRERKAERLNKKKRKEKYNRKKKEKEERNSKKKEKEERNIKLLEEQIKRERKRKADKRREKLIKKIFWLVVFLLIAYLWFFVVSPYLDQDSNEKVILEPKENNIIIPDYEIRASPTAIIIKNNLDKQISLNVTYRIYSKWFNIDVTQNKVFDVDALNEGKTFVVYDNSGCNTAPCSVIIINHNKV